MTSTLTPALRRDPDELDGFFEFLAREISHPGLSATVARVLAETGYRILANTGASVLMTAVPESLQS